MYFTQYTDVHVFHEAVKDILMRHEAQNVIPLGNILIGMDSTDNTGWRDPANFFMATVSNQVGIILTAIKTGDKNLAIYATDNKNDPDAITCLMEGMAQAGITLPGVLAEKSLAEMFEKLYTAKHNISSKINMSQRIYELEAVTPAIHKAAIRLAQERDMSFLPYWTEGLWGDALGKPVNICDDAGGYNYHIQQGRLYIMEDKGIPVSMAKISRDVKNVCVIGFVYTPPYFRKKGYATACVAAVTQIALNRGFKKCVLYTDLTNPISNSIYQKIGYRPICDSLEIGFE